MNDASATDSDRSGEENTGTEAIDEMREAAFAVVGSLKSLLVAAEKVVSDPAAFSQLVAGGKGMFEAFTSGFTDDSSRSESGPTDT